MIFQEEYEKLSSTEQKAFKEIVNDLLAHTYLLSRDYNFDEDVSTVNPDYIFAERNFEMIQDYLQYAGFQLDKDTTYGVIALSSTLEGNLEHFNKLTTLMTYALRLIYEEEREKLQLINEVFTTVGNLVNKLITLGAIPKKPANVDMDKALRTLKKYNIIKKVDGAWSDAKTRILILPSILFIVSNEQISNLSELIKTKENTDEETDEITAD
ncbi:MAG: DUF4194 domain-containing protein [Eubacterium sp.]|jgi:hypothetical protein|nr:DUF4194 domain-containing protein [Eubacterium sp.]MCH4047721.1 DUF4194 domain-containing protein [Eubacterium sp.]MCH4078493.1 DUF4194 domain-containing protein [Eubacterium sp.]MCH4109637.1 DUF4194 domain-containing protein [Eubacterium sp.]MCI1307826.1 DUF4194 domain-containing protein [Eubacterium sp.]